MATSKAIATEAWSQLVHSILSWTTPSNMSMEYYYTLREPNSNRLDIYEYKLGTDNIEARIQSGVHSQVVQANEHEYHKGIEYIQDPMQSTNYYNAVKARVSEDQQGIEYIQDPMRSTNYYNAVKARVSEDQQGIEYIQDHMRSTNYYNAVQANEGENEQGIEYVRDCIRSTNDYHMVQADEGRNQQSIDNIRDFVRSKGLPRGLAEPETAYQPRINIEQLKKMSILFDDLLEFIENYNMNEVEKPTLRFQVVEVIKLLHHYGIDTIRSGVEEELEHLNQTTDGLEKNSAMHYKKKALEVMLKICDNGTCQSTINEIIGKAQRDPVLFEW